ncbi:hypothetical protein D7X94_00565 [Acutalibacter sp. 1XD8-33]|uniref:PglD-related sugar-binding protein n=1 Tax=Acutalibacter sp. 1XD8-33 TaxID=2320081 RepID=UPI000EA390A8|nr:hypothetical protein [Acutalibacter sp. 1XD8-33]RKJ42005.1 hypothetical protein D7X94_00565 [Acutalibacter sp. 1XD8-33]
MMRKIAMCIPIYRTYELAQEFLENYSKNYLETGIDIYYYDSTPDDSVKSVIDKWVDNDRIFYLKMDSKLHSSEKVFKIYQGYGLQYEYQYIWLCNDGIRCSKMALETISLQLAENYDFIVLDPLSTSRTDQNIEKNQKVFYSQSEFFDKCLVATRLYGGTILNARTMLAGVDWERYESAYLKQGETMIWHAYMSFYFHRILELETFSAVYLPFRSDGMRISELKADSQWTNGFFFVLCEGLVQTIRELPDCYLNKQTICVRNTEELYFDRLSTLIRAYRRDNRYSLKVFLHYFQVWDWVTSIPRWQLFLAALVPKWTVSAIGAYHKRMGQRKLEKLCRTHSRIILYGAGGCGYVYSDYFKKMGMDYEAFCVTRRKPGKFQYCGHPVYELEELKSNLNNVGFIVAVGGNSTGVVFQNLLALVDRKDIFFEPKFQAEIRYEWAREKRKSR